MRGNLLLLLLGLALVNSEINRTFILKYENYTIPDMRFVCLNFEIPTDVSVKCAEQLQVVCENETLFLTMLDAGSKFPYSGLGYASRSDYGNFDQCLSIDHKYTGGRILGKHCTSGLIIPDILGNVSDPNSYYQLSVCKPDACSADDYVVIGSSIVGGFPNLFQDALCQTSETNKEFTATDIVTIIIFAIVLLLMIVSTIYDTYLHKTESKSPHPLYLAFSVLSNGRKLLHISRNSKEQIQTFHGLKVISMMWIIAGHGFSGWQNSPVTNEVDKEKWLHKRYSAYIIAGPLAVDTFFFISGFLFAFQYFKQKPRLFRTQVFSLPRLYLHRYLRLTPAMLMIYLVTISIFKHLGSGPLWTYGTERFAKPCRENWLPFFLYIQNYYSDYEDFCLVQTWYLSADMQMFIIAPMFLIPLSLNLRTSFGFLISMVELFILNIIWIALPMAVRLGDRDYHNEYDTHSRLINYFIGITLAFFMREKQDIPFLNMVNKRHISVTNLVTWIVLLLGMLTTVICYQEVETNHGYESKSVFYSLMRPAWCIGLSWIVYSCYHGYGGIVNWLLTSPVMHVFGRLTYCIYLTHLSVLSYYLLTPRDRKYFTDYNVFYVWCGHFTVSVVVAIFWTLAFESPLLIIEKQFLGGGNKTSQQQQNRIHRGNVMTPP